MAEELFTVRRLVEVEQGRQYPTGELATLALCSTCHRLYAESGFAITSAGLVTPDYVHAKGPEALASMLIVTMHSSNPANNVQHVRIPCELCGRPATDQGEAHGR